MDVIRGQLRVIVVALTFFAAHRSLPNAHSQAPELPPVGGGTKPKESTAPPLPPVGGGSKEPARPATGPSGPARLGTPVSEAPSAGPPASAGAVGGVPSAAPLGPSGADVELVEKVLAARRTYADSLQVLHDHYKKAGDARRAQAAEDELRAFHRAPHPVYRLDLDLPSSRLQPLYNQKEANDLVRWALTFKDKGVGTEYGDNQRRAEIILQELLTKYPQSNKIAEVAYLLGELYESRAFRQYERAAGYYERCFQWEPNTKSDARLRAARIYDRDLRDRSRAVELYRQVLDNDTIPARRQEAQRRLADLGAR